MSNIATSEAIQQSIEPSALSQLIESTSPGNPLAATTIQVLHNLQHQHNWTSLQTHDISSYVSEPAPSSAVQTIISGIPPNRIYTHPDEQLYMLERSLREEDLRPERQFVLPTVQGQSWSLRRMARVLDSLGDIDILPEEGAASATVEVDEKEKMLAEFYLRKEKARLDKEWGSQRVLLAMVDKAMGGDGTVVYYVVQEGEVKPRQN